VPNANLLLLMGDFNVKLGCEAQLRGGARPDSNQAVACNNIMALMCRGEVQRLEHCSGSGPLSDGCQVPSA